MTYDVKLLIGADNAAASNGATVNRIGPVTGKTESVFAAATVDDVNAAVEAAQRAFSSWSKAGPNVRRRILLKAADAIEARAPEFTAIMMAETGATTLWGMGNAKLAAETVREAAAMTTRILGETIPSDRPGTVSLALRKPVGVMVGIAPWNAPVILGARAIAMPIACGNTIILKGSEASPMTHRLVVDCFVEAGVPEGVINYINNDPEDAPQIVEALVSHKYVKRINFTGSAKVGKIIAGIAARDLKPCLFELGGKAPFVVLDDANLDEAVKAAAFGAFLNQGQICMSSERIIVAASVADTFAEKFKAKVAELRAGHPADDPQPLGGLIDTATAGRVKALVEDARTAGASIILEGKAEGAVMQASVVANVTQDMRIWSEESFGPVVCLICANDDDHAIELANDTDYGLTAAVYGSDISRAMKVADAIEAGMCHINGPTVYDEPQMPFGGVQDSGYGRFGGTFGIDSFTEVKWLTINSEPIHFPI